MAQLDVLQLVPHAQITRVYDVPGVKLTVLADAVGGAGADGIDVLVYGASAPAYSHLWHSAAMPQVA